MPSIFVSIASYRDKLCSVTLLDLYEKAQYPENIYVGICQQNKKGDAECFDFDHFRWTKQIQLQRLAHTEARGPTYARYLCTQMYNGEDFFLQIDSHCLFTRHWDTKLIQMILDVEKQGVSSKIILSHYPPTYGSYKENPKPKDPVTHITQCHFNDDGLLTFKGAVFKKPGRYPRRNAFVAAGFLFARGHLLKEVPWDPHLPYVFTGEEMLLSIRFFTHGWDVYTPNQNTVFHAYTRLGEPKFWDDHKYDTTRVYKKMKMIAGLIPYEPSSLSEYEHDFEKYGIGKLRTLKEFYQFVGVCPQSKKISKPLIEFYCSSTPTQSPSGIILYSVSGVFMISWVFLILFLTCRII